MLGIGSSGRSGISIGKGGGAFDACIGGAVSGGAMGASITGSTASTDAGAGASISGIGNGIPGVISAELDGVEAFPVGATIGAGWSGIGSESEEPKLNGSIGGRSTSESEPGGSGIGGTCAET